MDAYGLVAADRIRVTLPACGCTWNHVGSAIALRCDLLAIAALIEASDPESPGHLDETLCHDFVAETLELETVLS